MQMLVDRDNFYDLYNNSWSGAVDTLNVIAEHKMEYEFMDYLEIVFEGYTPTETEVNDFIWFESDIIFSDLGINEDEEEDEE